MKIFPYKEILDIFKYTIDNDDVTMTQLIDRVGKGVADEVTPMATPTSEIFIFAGWGLNGAYALAAAHHLLRLGFDPEIYLFNIGGNRITADCANAKKLLLKEFKDCKLHEIVTNLDLPDLTDENIVIDGLFGGELDHPLAKSLGIIIRYINESGATIVSIELPSGLFSEWNTNNSISRDIIHANLTIAIEFPLLSYFMTENIKLIGRWKILEIGLSAEAIRRAKYIYYLVERGDIHRILRHRRPDTSKADYGSALICAGSFGMMGAAVLASRACLRAGVGKVTCYGPRCGYSVLQTAVPCAMFASDARDNEISKIVPRHKYDAIAIGPGISVTETTVNAVENYLNMCYAKRQPLIIDADALNCIAQRPIMLNYLPELSVLTPHAGEFDRIFGAQPSAEARLRKALEISAYHNIIIILKGHYTMIVRPDGKVYINSSGTAALATPGSGDVLTGVITAMVAQGYTSETSSLIAVYLHGFAGQMAEEEQGQYGVTANDVAEKIGKAIKTIMH